MTVKHVKLGDVAEFIRGITFTPQDVLDEFANDSVAVMRTKNVQETIDLEDVWKINKSFVKNENQYLYEGDLLVSSANSWNLVGKASWIPKLEYKSTFGGFVTVLRGDVNKINKRYLYYWFVSKKIQAMLRSFGNKTTNISNLNLKRSLELSIPLPPLAEQQRIADQLDKADRIMRLREQAIAKLDELAQNVFAEMFGDLFVGRDDWQRTQLGKLRAEKRGSIDPSKYPNEVFTLYSIPGYDRCQQDILAGKDIGSTKQVVQTNDVLISKIVPHIRRAWIVGDEFTNRQIASGEWIVFASEQFKPAVLRYLFLSDAFHKRFMTTIAGVGGSLLRAQPRLVNEFKISVPPLSLQENFARFIIKQANHRTLLEKSQATFSTLFSSLQSQSFLVN